MHKSVKVRSDRADGCGPARERRLNGLCQEPLGQQPELQSCLVESRIHKRIRSPGDKVPGYALGLLPRKYHPEEGKDPNRRDHQCGSEELHQRQRHTKNRHTAVARDL